MVSFQILLSFLYRFFYKINRFLFLRPKKALQHSQLIVVGSYLIGGAGKTPFSLFLAKQYLNKNKSVGILCHSKADDEYQWLQQKVPEAKIYKTKNRFSLAKQLDGKLDILISDDGFEDSRLVPDKKILLQWDYSPCFISDLYPSGSNRSLKDDHSDITNIFFCGDNFIDPDLVFTISEIVNAQGQSLNGEAIAMCGIGNPHRFFNDLERFGISITEKIIRPDHDHQFEKYLKKELQQNKPIVITEKDACRLSQETKKNPLLFIAIQKLTILHDFVL